MTRGAERTAHMDRVARAIDFELASNGPVDLVVLPELGSLDYSRSCFDRLSDLAEPLEASPTIESLRKVAQTNGVAILAGMARQEPGKDAGTDSFITQALIAADGKLAAHYDKLHIAQFGESTEKDYFVRGDRLLVFEIGGFTFGTIICYDIRIPELSRVLARRHGVDVILHPTAFCRDETFHTWQAFATTRAIENQVYFVSVNRAGDDFGDSMLIEPWMDETVPLRQLSTGEEFARWTLSRSVLDHARSSYPFLSDVRDDYETLPKAMLRE
ncbi:MAG TPA: carbon-nitrogen hydrolase family protein [Alphaproteobacteria bacterium]|nr:MAG: carbon-nitrogen hydrolase family protein [Candidatus Puniceispirillum sp. TMED245]HCV88008.1 carbon-nitrogen hydrolase family protein [Alphaproteobacteria bacterium]